MMPGKFRFVLFALILLYFENVNAQNLCVQLNIGLMNYGGDLRSEFFTFNQSHLTAGANVMYNVNHFTLRTGFAYGNVEANDKFTDRNLSFKSSITEFNFCLEYDFFHAEKDSKLIPYVFAGIGFYHYNPFAIYNSQKVYLRPLSTEGEGLSKYPDRKVYSLTNFEDPFGVGIKYKLSTNFLVGVEFNSRLLFSDYLDDVSKKYPDENELFKAKGQLAVDLSYRGNQTNPTQGFPSGRARGNPHQNDNYYTSIITLTYMFPEGGLFSNGSHGRHSLNCPRKVH